MNNEIRIYVVDLSETKRGESFTQTSDFKEFVEEAERQGLVFSLSFFLDKLNSDEINITNSYSRAGIVKEGEEVEEIPFNTTVTVSNEDNDCLNYGVEVDIIDHVEDCKACLENCETCVKKYSCELCKQIQEKEKELIYNDNKTDRVKGLTIRNTFDDIVKFILGQINEHALAFRYSFDKGQLDTIKNIKKLYDERVKGVSFTNQELETINNTCFKEFRTLCDFKNNNDEEYLNIEAIENKKTLLRKIMDKTCIEE